jgi:hypothetical protein
MSALREIPVRKIIAAIADAARRWSDADFPPRVRITEQIAKRTGYSVPAVEYALDRLFRSITSGDLESVIRAELGSLDVLDGFAARRGKPDAYAAPVGSACIISSRTTIGVAIVPAIFALCAKCSVLVKDCEDRLVRAFFETLREEGDAFAVSARAQAWNSQDATAPDLQSFDAVVAFGSNATLTSIAEQLTPSTRFIGYGSRASAGYVTRGCLKGGEELEALAAGAARDLVLYESEGCLSLHVLFVEHGGDLTIAEFGRILAGRIERANVEFPIGERSAAKNAAIAQERDLAAFRAAAGNAVVYADANAAYAVIVGHPPSDPPRFLPRTIGLVAVDDATDAVRYVREHRIPLEGFALSEARTDVVRAALDAGAVRLTRFGELQHPPLAGDHGGRPRIAEFVRWIDRTL